MDSKEKKRLERKIRRYARADKLRKAEVILSAEEIIIEVEKAIRILKQIQVEKLRLAGREQGLIDFIKNNRREEKC